MSILAQDLTYALRTLRRRRGFSAIAVLTLGLGIGSATAIFTIVDGVLLRPLPFAAPASLVTIWKTDTLYRAQPTLRSRWDRLWFNYPEYRQWSGDQRSLSMVALYGDQTMSLTGTGDPAQATVFTATPNLMAVLGETVRNGRWFAPSEVGAGTDRVAVISNEMWRTRFGADSSMVGRLITLNEQPFRVIGVAPPGLRLRALAGDADAPPPAAWIPLGSDGGGQAFDNSYEAIGRLRPGITLATAESELDRLVRGASGHGERGARVLLRLDAETASARKPLALLSAGVAVLLMIACANLALLMLGEAPAREREIAVRRALGASSARIVKQLLAESGVIALIGGCLGAVMAAVGMRLLVQFAPVGIPRMDDVSVDGRAVAFSVAVVAVTALTFGLVPAFSELRWGTRVDRLRQRAGELRVGQRRVQEAVIAVQVAVALVLLSGAALLTRSLHNLLEVEPGFRPQGVVTLSVAPPKARYVTPASIAAYYDQLETRLQGVPGVTSVGASSNLPFSDRNQTTSIEIEGTPSTSDAKPNVQRRVVTAGYFATMGIPLRAGRLFTDEEPATGDAMVVDEEMAHRLWPAEPGLGKRVKVYGAWFRVVAVVGSAHHARLDETPRPTFYLPQSRMTTRDMAMVARVDGDPLASIPALRRAVWSVDPSIPISDVSTMDLRLARSASDQTYRTALLDTFAAVAAFLAAVGIVGVTARTVSQRRHEIGIRLALGASQSSIGRLVVRRHVTSVGMGLAFGLGLVLAVAPQLNDFAFQTSPTNPATLAVAALVLLGAGFAGMLPGLFTAVRVDPVTAMRDAD